VHGNCHFDRDAHVVTKIFTFIVSRGIAMHIYSSRPTYELQFRRIDATLFVNHCLLELVYLLFSADPDPSSVPYGFLNALFFSSSFSIGY